MPKLPRLPRMVGAWLALAVFGLGVVPAQAADSILFVGNSYTYGAYSPVWHYRSGEVTDLNGDGVGGVPALFKLFTREAGLDYAVSLETVGGKDLRFHLEHKKALIDRAWDHVVLQSFSTLSAAHPGDAADLVTSAAELAALFHDHNPKVDVRLDATWSRPDLTYRTPSPWFGKPITAMAEDVQAGYLRAKAASPFIAGVVPVGAAFNGAVASGLAAANPYEGIAYGKIDLWAFDNYHASAFGYYLEALMVFGAITGCDPTSLGARELAAAELGFSPAQTTALQQIARDALAGPPAPPHP